MGFKHKSNNKGEEKRRVDGERERQREREREREREIQTDRQIDRQTDRETDRQTDRQTEWRGRGVQGQWKDRTGLVYMFEGGKGGS